MPGMLDMSAVLFHTDTPSTCITTTTQNHEIQQCCNVLTRTLDRQLNSQLRSLYWHNIARECVTHLAHT